MKPDCWNGKPDATMFAAGSRRTSRLLDRRSLLSAAATLWAWPKPSMAQSFPNRPIMLVVPFAAGGPTDVVGRLLAQSMTETLGQQVIVENVSGAGGTLGMTRVAESTPDGYVLGLGSMGTQSAALAAYPLLKYDPANSFEQLGLVNFTPVVVAARKNFPANTLEQFLTEVRREGGRITHGHAGLGSAAHAAGVLFNNKLGLKPTLVPYRGTGPALNDLIGGSIDYLTDQALNLTPQIQAGSIRAYALAAPKRLSVLKDVPTTGEAGVDFVFSNWNALVAPKALPGPVRDKLVDALDKALRDDRMIARLAELASTPPPPDARGPAALQAHVEREIAVMVPLLKAAGSGK